MSDADLKALVEKTANASLRIAKASEDIAVALAVQIHAISANVSILVDRSRSKNGDRWSQSFARFVDAPTKSQAMVVMFGFIALCAAVVGLLVYLQIKGN